MKRFFAGLHKAYLDFMSRRFPWTCTICGRESRDWSDRIKFVGRLVWMNNGFYEGGAEEMYCPEHADWMPRGVDSREARRRYYSGERQ